MKQMTLRMPEELHRRVGHEAVERDISVTHCIIALLEEALAACRTYPPTDRRARKES